MLLSSTRCHCTHLRLSFCAFGYETQRVRASAEILSRNEAAMNNLKSCLTRVSHGGAYHSEGLQARLLALCFFLQTTQDHGGWLSPIVPHRKLPVAPMRFCRGISLTSRLDLFLRTVPCLHYALSGLSGLQFHLLVIVWDSSHSSLCFSQCSQCCLPSLL